MNETSQDFWNVTVDDDLLEEKQNENLPKRDLLYLTFRYLLFISSSLSDILIIYTYYKQKTLRDQNNVLLIHWAVANLYYFLHQLIIADLICFTMIGLSFSPLFVVVISSTCLIFTYIIALAMLFRWMLVDLRPRLYERVQGTFDKYLLYAVYSLGATIFIFDYLYHVYRTIEVAVFCIESIVIVSIILNIVILCCRLVRLVSVNSKPTNYILYVADAIIASLIPMIVYHYLFLLFIEHSSFVLDVIFFTRIIPQLILFGHPIVVSAFLFKFSKDFNTGFKVTIRILLRSQEGYNDWILIDELEN